MLSTRFVLLLGGLVVAYFAAYFGDGLYVLTVADQALPREEQSAGILPTSVISIVIFAVGGFVWVVAMANLLSHFKDHERASDETIAACAIVSFVCISCLFGILAGPFANYGAYPLNWLSRWNWLPVLAFVPVVLVFRDAFSSMMAARREKKNS